MCDDNESFSLISSVPDIETVYTHSDTEPGINTPEPSVQGDQYRRWESASSCSTSLTPSVHQHEFAYGRRYHGYKCGRYPLPNDILEEQREDTRHALMLELMEGRLFYSDVGDYPQKIIDIGTGTGTWAIDVADMCPSANVIGTDLSPIQPTWLPINSRMFVEDCEDPEWLHGRDFDLVHLRDVAGMVKDLDGLLRKVYPNVRNGGWVEMQEFLPGIRCDDGTMSEHDSLSMFFKLACKGMSQLGFGPIDADGLRVALERAGFKNIKCIAKKIPISTWSRDEELRPAGIFMKGMMLESISAFGAKPLAALHMSAEERLVAMARARESLDDRAPHRYMTFCFCFGQKRGLMPDSE